MKSHLYCGSFRQWLAVALPTPVMFVSLMLTLSLLSAMGWLPRRLTITDADRGLIVNRARMVRGGPDAEIVLAGDSTCLIGVDASALSRQLPGKPRVLNLALDIWYDLGMYGQMVSDYASAHPGKGSTIVLLVTPAKLAGMGNPQLTRPQVNGSDWAAALNPDCGVDWNGARVLRRSFLERLLQRPLRGTGASFFGFAPYIDDYMTKHNGSGVDFGTFVPPKGPARTSWKLAPDLEPESRAFRAKLPAHAKLIVGLTPTPRSVSTTLERESRLHLLSEFNEWVYADALLTNLPATLPDVFFSKTAHLNPAGQRKFTEILGKTLAQLVKSSDEPNLR